MIVCNESKSRYLKTNRRWCVGYESIDERETYCHLGIHFTKLLDNHAIVKDVNSKLRRTFFGVGGFGHQGLHPLTLKKVYKAKVLPKALYGCEMVYNLNDTDLLSLERSHRFCCKLMQCIGSRTRTIVALGLLGMFSIKAEIILKKLTLFTQHIHPKKL